MSLATKDLHFFFDGSFHKQIDGVATESHLGPTLANAYLLHSAES